MHSYIYSYVYLYVPFMIYACQENVLFKIPLIEDSDQRRDECYPKQSNGSWYQSSSFPRKPKELGANLRNYPSVKAGW